MMSTDTVKLEELSLQPADSEKGTDGLPTAPTEPLKQDDATDNTQATSSSGEGTTVQRTAVKVTTSRWITLLIAVATLLGNGFLSAGISIIAPFYPIAAQSYSVAIYIVGFVIGTAAVCVMVASPIVGYFLPHLGLKFTQLAGLFWAGGSLLLFGFVFMMPSQTSFLAFSFLLRIVEGIGTAMYSTASYVQLATFYPENKATIVGLLQLSLVIGLAAGPAMGGGLQQAGGFLLPFVLIGGCIIALMLLLTVLIPPTECTSVKLPWRLVLKLATNIVFILLLVSFMLAIVSLYAVFAFFGRFIYEQFHLSLGVIGAAYLAPTLAYAVGSVVVGPIADKLKTPRMLIVIGLVVTAIGCVFLGPPDFITTPKLWLSILANVILGAGAALIVIPVYPDIYGIAQAVNVGEDETAVVTTVSGIFIGVNSAGESLGSIIGGALVYQLGFRSMAAVLGLILLVYALVVFTVTMIQKCLKSRRSNKQ